MYIYLVYLYLSPVGTPILPVKAPKVSICLYISLSIYPSIYPSIHLSIYLSIYLLEAQLVSNDDVTHSVTHRQRPYPRCLWNDLNVLYGIDERVIYNGERSTPPPLLPVQAPKLSTYSSKFLSFNVSIYIYVYLSLHIYLNIYLSIYLYNILSIAISIYLSIYLSRCQKNNLYGLC